MQRAQHAAHERGTRAGQRVEQPDFDVGLELQQQDLGIVGLATAKVFLLDMSGLEGAWRALSFIGLGLALVGIGLVYQKFVFVRSASDRSSSVSIGAESSAGPGCTRPLSRVSSGGATPS